METHNNLVQSDQDLLGKIIVKCFRAMVDGLDFMKKKKEGSGQTSKGHSNTISDWQPALGPKQYDKVMTFRK